MRKDKKQVIGDEIGDEQIKLFLDFEPVDATSPRCTNWSRLIVACVSMISSVF
jgi:hypothetical protein